MRKFFLFFLLFFLFSIFIYADYPYLGGSDGFYKAGLGYFNADVNVSEFVTTTEDANLFSPLVTDIDNDGTNEIIVIDGEFLRIYSVAGGVFIVEGVYNTNSPELAQPYIYDIDNFYIRLEFNGTDFNITDNSIGTNWGNVAGGFIGCRAAEQCILVYQDTANNNLIEGFAFNSTNLTQSGVTNIYAAGASDSCLPNLASMQIADIDGDSTDEFIISFFKANAGSDTAFISQLSIVAGTLTEENTKSVGLGDSVASCGFATNIISSPLVFDFDHKRNGLEVLVAGNVNANEYKMFLFDSNLDAYDDFPYGLFEADGQIISNIVQMNAFDDTDDVDACILGYDDSSGEIDLLCASKRGTGIESKEFEFDFNVSDLNTSDLIYENVIHAVQMSQTLTVGQNYHEILTPFGVFELTHETVLFVRNNILAILWSNTITGSATIIPADVTGNGRLDLVAYSGTNLWMLSDSFMNTHCDTHNCIRDGSYTNPSIENPIKINTTFAVGLKIEDYDGDKVAGRVILYADSTNEQDSGWSNNYTSGTLITYSDFKVNKTGSYNIKFMARDTDNPAAIQTITLPFTVAVQGDEFGDSKYEFGSTPEIDAEEDADSTALNPVAELVDSFADGTDFTTSAIWKFLMLLIPLIGIVFLFGLQRFGSHDIIGIIVLIGLAELFMVIYGASVGYLSVAWIYVIAVFMLAGLGFYIRNIIGGTRQ